MMARLNLYRLVDNPYESVRRGDADVLINSILTQDEETYIHTV